MYFYTLWLLVDTVLRKKKKKKKKKKDVGGGSTFKAPGIRLLTNKNMSIIQQTQKEVIRYYQFPSQKSCLLTYNGSLAAVGGIFVVALTLETFQREIQTSVTSRR